MAPTSLPNSDQKLDENWPPVRDHIHGEPVKAEHMLDQKLDRLLGRGQLLEGHEVCHLAEPVSNSGYYRVPFRAGQASDEVQGDVGPRVAGNRQRLEEAHRAWREGLCSLQEAQAGT